MSSSLQPHGLYSHWNSPGQDTGVGSLSLLQGILPTQGHPPLNFSQKREFGHPAFPYKLASLQIPVLECIHSQYKDKGALTSSHLLPNGPYLHLRAAPLHGCRPSTVSLTPTPTSTVTKLQRSGFTHPCPSTLIYYPGAKPTEKGRWKQIRTR